MFLKKILEKGWENCISNDYFKQVSCKIQSEEKGKEKKTGKIIEEDSANMGKQLYIKISNELKHLNFKIK